ncbi:hypothetical protein DKX38_024658 [Salix brachista]|uniref:Uncharacterized protein n=1 Tax=Salix brachista TaxID=2182728 RepID=A0A5N5JM76_9ROSI|nr:hypothetical protein DKX38_024658 [Salix brachista]
MTTKGTTYLCSPTFISIELTFWSEITLVHLVTLSSFDVVFTSERGLEVLEHSTPSANYSCSTLQSESQSKLHHKGNLRIDMPSFELTAPIASQTSNYQLIIAHRGLYKLPLLLPAPPLSLSPCEIKESKPFFDWRRRRRSVNSGLQITLFPSVLYSKSCGLNLLKSVDMARQDHGSSSFEQSYRCYPVSFIDKAHLERGDKIIMPPSALDRLVMVFAAATLHIDYPMLFELHNPYAGRTSHCGVLEFIADEGMIYLPYWMMENMLLQEGDIVELRSTSLAKGTFVKLQPHTMDFLDISNPKAILETSLRSYSCLTTGDTIMVAYNNKKYYIDIVEAKPSSAISIIETDCEVDFAPPLDYKEPEKPKSIPISNKTSPEGMEEPAAKKPKFSAFTGSSRRLDGKPATQPTASTICPTLKQHQPETEKNGSKLLSPSSHQQSGKLVFGSTSNQPQNETPKVPLKKSTQEPPQKVEEPEFQAFTGRKYSLKG